jgi:NAD(P)-dependent dehydrogenase (short-subunit alcohol dehydrogenase family)
VFITGSADGLGLALGERLISEGHEVVLHGRSEQRAADAQSALPEAVAALPGDLSSVGETRDLAARASECGPYDAVVHNAGLGFREQRHVTDDGVERVFAVNVLAPYILTALMPPGPRLIYLSSGLHERGRPRLDDLAWEDRPWDGMQAYSDSKLLDVALAFAVARRRPDTISTAVEPGWIATKMGGARAPGTLEEGTDTQDWLITTDDADSGELYHRREAQRPAEPAMSQDLQEELLATSERVSGVRLS